MRKINEVVVHCLDTPPKWGIGRGAQWVVSQVRTWHVRDRGWSDGGYHFIIHLTGERGALRPIERVGAGIKGKNTGKVHIGLVGGQGSHANDSFSDHFTPEQDKELRELISELKTEYPTIKRVSGHNEHANRACPGFHVPTWYNRKSPRDKITQSSTVKAGGVSLAAIAGAVGTVFPALSSLDPKVQLLLVGFAGVAALGIGWMVRERLKRWARGDR